MNTNLIIPERVDPVIAAFGRSWNDSLPSDAERARLLRPLIPLTVGTAGSPSLQDRRAIAVADWAVRTFTPPWLRLAGLDEHADVLAGLDELTSIGALRSAVAGPIRSARDAATAAGDAAWAATSPEPPDPTEEDNHG